MKYNFDYQITLKYICLYLLILLISCNKANDPDNTYPCYTSFDISPVQESLISEDHTSEGMLLTLPNGRIIHFFRLDKGIYGDHTSNGGAIYKRYSDNNALSWSSPELVYDTPELDDRNIGGGIIRNNNSEVGILLVFRTFKATGDWGCGTHVDTGYIVSWDGGETFSHRKLINDLNNGMVPMLLTSLDDGEYIMPFYGKYAEIEKVKVEDNKAISFNTIFSFDQEEYMQDLAEPAIINTENNLLSIIFRNNKSSGVWMSIIDKTNLSYVTKPKKTNIIPEHKISLPLFFFDSKYTNKYWFLGGDRRFENKEEAKLWIYSNNQLNEEFFLEKLINRPYPNEWLFYCYPSITLMNNGKYLIVFTESYMDYENNENADFYQLTLTPIP